MERTRLHAEYEYFATKLQSVFLFLYCAIPYRIGYYYIGRIAIYRDDTSSFCVCLRFECDPRSIRRFRL